MLTDDLTKVLVFGLVGSFTFLVGFSASIVVNIRYAFYACLAGMCLGGLSYIMTTHWTFGYMMGGLGTFIAGTGMGLYYFIVKYHKGDFFHHGQSAHSGRKDGSNTIHRTGGSWK